MRLRKIIIAYLLIVLQFLYIGKCFAKPPAEEVRVVLNGDEKSEIEIQEDESKKIYSESAILIEEQTGKVLYDKNIYERKYPASTTKILTAIIALEKCDLDETATASEFAVSTVKAGYTNADIKVGETLTVGELLDVMMIVSANEAATILAEHISGNVSEFANLMNEKAKEIGCQDSHFVNANGIHDDNHYTTAYDLAMIMRYGMQNEKFRELIGKKTCSLPTTDIYVEAVKASIEAQNEKNKNKKRYTPKTIEDVSLERNFVNTNSLLKKDSNYYYPYCIGGKTGFTTPAKNCLVSVSNKDGFETIAVVLHAENTDDNLSARYTDTIKLFEYGYKNYTLNEILEEYEPKEKDSENKLFFFAGLINLNGNNDDNNNGSIIIDKSPYIMILIGLIILLGLFMFFLFKTIKKMKNRKLYSFKVD